jgi:N-acetylglucosaminyl-diphospho-decaprenol L-rhamnosyltransferase
MGEAGLTSIADLRVAPAVLPADTAIATAAPELSIVIVTWNSERWIERCLHSLPAACEGLSYEVVLYDNASVDGTLRLVAPDSARIMRSDHNDGFAAALNRAVAETNGRYVFLLNPDCDLAPRALTLLCAFLDRNPNAAAAAPLLVY